MRVLLALGGRESDGWYERMVRLVSLERAEGILLAHVIDSGPRADMDVRREGRIGRRHLGEDRMAEVDQAENEGAIAVLDRAQSILEAAQVPPERIQRALLRGKPGEAVRDLAERQRVDLIVVAGRLGKPGPHSLGKTARFLVDHAPVAALLVREI